jgi:cytidylate kinase
VWRTQRCSEGDAKDYIAITDEGRADFIKRYFQHDIADARLYDLVVNLQQISRSEAVQLIAKQVALQAERVQEASSRVQSTARQFTKLEQRIKM